jgi:hypothetical protein
MRRYLLGKTLALGVVVLFIGLGIHPAFAVDTRQSMVSKASEEECWNCKKINDRQLVVLEKQLNRLEVYSKLLLVMSKHNPDLREIRGELSDRISTFSGLFDVSADELSPIICDVLWNIVKTLQEFMTKLQDENLLLYAAIFFYTIYSPVVITISAIGIILLCDWIIAPLS